ncbi:hypothetical protein BCR32DRAFT_241036 [Anaeromyces robustus]|uniref:DUF567-domain-containing protein n=1 Tax=Anaeromyces robustus TaxID=1754192 RepID=A0A1Y1XKV1_9FUNG|nr:hypothetical protein BCR32DRAFT_241036 [Anaeromyces robustus]|eukprot:ORX86323.1 hypothetical protein BCR32DRAFT_241036 [Anaeromyces robustus]
MYTGQIAKPPMNIAVYDTSYIFPVNVTLLIQSERLSYRYFKFSGLDGSVYFKTADSFSKVVICNDKNEPLFNIRDIYDYKIYLGKKKEKFIFKTKCDSPIKTRVIYTNLITGMEEEIEMKSDPNYSYCKIFHGKEKENAPLIAKIVRSNKESYSTDNFSIEMPAGVDNLFLIALASIFLENYRIISKHN